MRYLAAPRRAVAGFRLDSLWSDARRTARSSETPAVTSPSSPGRTRRPGSDLPGADEPRLVGLKPSFPTIPSHPYSRSVSRHLWLFRTDSEPVSDASGGGHRLATSRDALHRPSKGRCMRAHRSMPRSVSASRNRGPKAWPGATSPAGHRQSSSASARHSTRRRVEAQTVSRRPPPGTLP